MCTQKLHATVHILAKFISFTRGKHAGTHVYQHVCKVLCMYVCMQLLTSSTVASIFKHINIHTYINAPTYVAQFKFDILAISILFVDMISQ